jgi:pyruvate ferredoxin oxidoreductase alpha subunit
MKTGTQFLSGNDAAATGVALARPQVIPIYPITPQTTLVERLAEWHAQGTFRCELLHVESEHSALSAAMGASALGARTFTATSSQGLLYMCECLHYAAGGRFPIVMVNANRAVALPWNIYGDQRDALSQLESGWIQLYAADAQEALDLTLQAFYLAEHKDVVTPVMLNVDGFSLTHTYESVQVPSQEAVDDFLPPFIPAFKMDLESPLSLGFSAGPRDNTAFKIAQHRAVLASEKVFEAIDKRFGEVFGRTRGGAVEAWGVEGADVVVVTLGSLGGILRETVEGLRAEGKKVGLVRLRMLRPFPAEALRGCLRFVRKVGVLEKNVSVGFEGTVCTQVRAALQPLRASSPTVKSLTGGLGGRDLSVEVLRGVFESLEKDEKPERNEVGWVDPGVVDA